MFSFFVPLSAQTNNKQKKADDYARQAVALIDDKQDYDGAIGLLEKALKLVPKSLIYQYELAYTYYVKKDFAKAIKYLKKTLNKKDVVASHYQLLGNAYDLSDKTDKAEQIFLKGIKKFSDAGQLYVELGGIYYRQNNNDKAVAAWEQGIENAPNFASNYYWASLLYCNSSEKIWGLFYAEIFLNLEPMTERSDEISNLLYHTLRSGIRLAPTNEGRKLSFSERSRMFLLLEDEQNTKLPFQVLFDMNFAAGLGDYFEEISIENIYQLKKLFINSWFERKYDKQYENVLFEWQKKIIEAGHFEAYCYWLLNLGNPKEFDNWLRKNEIIFRKFIVWMGKNHLRFDDKHKFYKLQYL
ncbi:MAG: tetratricopeptide repeat protein [Chitinophagales bacterium]